MKTKVLKPEEHFITGEPYYQPIGQEIAVFEAAYRQQLPVLLKGPTGCGKTRFMEHMAWRLQRPLITVSCHDDLTASDLVGRFLITGGETTWIDGPLASVVCCRWRKSASCCRRDPSSVSQSRTTRVTRA
jgi:nitric oxide reductase NorQ protein